MVLMWLLSLGISISGFSSPTASHQILLQTVYEAAFRMRGCRRAASTAEGTSRVLVTVGGGRWLVGKVRGKLQSEVEIEDSKLYMGGGGGAFMGGGGGGGGGASCMSNVDCLEFVIDLLFYKVIISVSILLLLLLLLVSTSF